jgi:putative PIN family toxin of toxin-antitoxin system
MPNPTPRIKVFIDTSVLIAGVASVTGASATVLDLCEAESIQMVISRQVLVEADRNFSAKLPALLTQFRQFIRNLAPLLVEDPPKGAVARAAALTAQKDAAILAAATEAKVDYLIPLDKKHFLKPKVKESIPLAICSPDEFLRMFESLWLPD